MYIIGFVKHKSYNIGRGVDNNFVTTVYAVKMLQCVPDVVDVYKKVLRSHPTDQFL